MLILSALFLYTLKIMRNINIPSGRGIILSGDRRKAGSYIAIAKRRMYEMKQMMKIGKLKYMKRVYYLDRDCVWVHLTSIDGADFMRIHSCAEDGKCKYALEFADGSSESSPYVTRIKIKAWDDAGDAMPLDWSGPTIDAWLVFTNTGPIVGDPMPGDEDENDDWSTFDNAWQYPDAFGSHPYDGGGGDKQIDMYIQRYVADRESVSGSVDVDGDILTATIDTSEFKGAEGWLRFNLSDFAVRSDISMTVDGVDVTPMVVVNTLMRQITHYFPAGTGTTMIVIVTLEKENPTEADWILADSTPTFIFKKYGPCRKQITANITVPIVEDEE